MNAPFVHIITDTFAAHVRATAGKPCSVPILLDMSALEDNINLDQAQYGTWLSDEELRHLHQFALAKRRKEWLAGRICAKAAIDDYFYTHSPGSKIPTRTEVTITNSGTGRPYAIMADGERLPEGPDISISHSSGLAVALAARECCGVDIQKTDRALLRVKERFCTDQEERLLSTTLRNNDHLMSLALLWAAKEAAKKALSMNIMPGFLDLVLAGIENTGQNEWFLIFRGQHCPAALLPEIRVAVVSYRTYALGFCIP